MLISIRNKATGWIAWLIVIIIAIPFALFGINSYFDGGSEINVASVDGEKISLQNFQREMNQRRRSFQQQFGDNFNPSMIDNPAYRNQIVEGLVSNQIIRQYVQDKGLRTSDEALRERITSVPNFQENGQFSKTAYQRLIASAGFTVEGFEQQERINGALQQLSQGLSSSAFTSRAEEDRLLALNMQERSAEYLIIPASELVEAAEVSQDEIQAEYDKNQDNYQQAAQIKANYIELSVSDLAKKVELDDEEIEQAYEASKAQYTQPEARKASHILLSVPKSADDAEKELIKAKAESILAEAKGGTDFSKLAEEHSQDPGSKRNGGDLGLIAKGQMVPAFEEAVFEMQADEVRGPIETQFGYHIIKLTEFSPERLKTLDEARDQVVKTEKKRLAETQFFDKIENLKTLTFENPDSLEFVATELGLEVKTTDWFEQASPLSNTSALLRNPKFRNAAFTDLVLQDNLNSEAIEISDDHIIALRKNDYEAAHIKPLNDVTADIKASLKQSKGADAAEEAGKAVISQLQADESLDESIESTRETLPAKRTESTSSEQRAIAAAVFTAQKPNGSAVIDGLRLNTGDYAVYILNEVKAGDPSTAEDSDRQRIHQQLIQRDGSQYYAAFQRQLRSSADVTIFTSTIEDDDDTASQY